MISIVLPIYNEEKSIEKVIDSIRVFFNKKGQNYEIIAVNDGSQDKTGDILKIYKENIRVVTHAKNIGYGAALRSGFKEAKGDLIFFMDSDGQFDIKDINNFLEKIKDYDFIAGYRKERKDPRHRSIFANIFKFIVRILFGLKSKDIDCAFKLFKRDTLSKINLESNGALINLEIFILARQNGFNFIELPVSHFKRAEGKPTGGNFFVIFKAMANLMRFWWKNLDIQYKKIIGIAIVSIFAAFFIANIGFIIFENSFPTLQIWNRWDTVHYLYLAQNGYCNFSCIPEVEKFSIVFFPLYPLIVKIFSAFIKNYLLSALFVSNICFIFLLYFFYKLLRKDFSEEISFNSVLFLSIFPTAYFFHIGYSESLFLFLTIMSIYYARREKWLIASVFGMLACLARINGIVLLPVILVEYLLSKKFTLAKIKADIANLIIIPIGGLVYLFINYRIFGNPLQFTIFMKEHWYKYFAWPWDGISTAIKSISWRDPRDWLMVGFAEPVFAIIALILIILYFKKIRFSYLVYSFLTLFLVTSTSFLISIPRYVLSIFPIFISLAILSKKHIFLYYLIIIIFLMLQSVFLIQFTRGQWAF